MSIQRSFLGALALALLLVTSTPGCGSTDETVGSGGSGGSGGGSSSDDCIQGVNMTDPRLAGGLEQGSGGAKLRILWDLGTGRGADLPSSYFDSITTGGADAAAVVSATHTAPREITVTFVDLAPILAKQSSLSFTLAFLDRRDFIACSHPGMPDRYLLDVTMTFDQSGEIASSELKEHINLGDI